VPAAREPAATLPLILEHGAGQGTAAPASRASGPKAPPVLPSGSPDYDPDPDDEATVVRSGMGAASAIEVASPPRIPPAAGAPPRDDFPSLVRAAVNEAIGPLERALQNQQRTVLDLTHRLEALERRTVSALPPTATSASTSAYAGASTSAYPVPISVAPAAPSFAPVAPSPVELSALDRNVLAALDGGTRRRRIITTMVIALLLLFGGLSLKLVLGYLPHAPQ
jgi:hypothetical protein